MTQLKIILISIFLIGFASCNDEKKDTAKPVDSGVSTFYFVRHAEKDRSNEENSDPELSQDGMGRAMHWAEILKNVELDAVYSTDYQRTSMTASPIAIKQDVDVEYYDPRIIDVTEFKQNNINKNVLVVGHSNTTPDFVNQMIGNDLYAEMDDSDNGSLFIVQIVNGVATSQQLNFNCNCPKR